MARLELGSSKLEINHDLRDENLERADEWDARADI